MAHEVGQLGGCRRVLRTSDTVVLGYCLPDTYNDFRRRRGFFTILKLLHTRIETGDRDSHWISANPFHPLDPMVGSQYSHATSSVGLIPSARARARVVLGRGGRRPRSSRMMVVTEMPARSASSS